MQTEDNCARTVLVPHQVQIQFILPVFRVRVFKDISSMLDYASSLLSSLAGTELVAFPDQRKQTIFLKRSARLHRKKRHMEDPMCGPLNDLH